MGKKKKQRKIPLKTGRVVHHFWLNINNDREGVLDNEMRELKKQRKFAETIRDGLRLILDLRAGSLVVLFELFPHLQERLAGQAITPVPKPPIPDPTEFAREVATQIILQGGADKILMQSTQPAAASSKTLTSKKFDLPTFEDDDLETQPAIVFTKTGTSINISKNFLGGLSSLR